MNMNKIVEIAKEVENKSSKRITTIVFMDGSITQVLGSWTANKSVWSLFEGKVNQYETIVQLVNAYETKDGIPAYPPGYTQWRKDNQEMADKMDSVELGNW